MFDLEAAACSCCSLWNGGNGTCNVEIKQAIGLIEALDAQDVVHSGAVTAPLWTQLGVQC